MTEKLDGEMMCGVVRDGGVELWLLGGWTEQARSATRWASERAPGVLQVIAQVHESDAIATFENIGKQSRVKVQYRETDLVLVTVRDNETARWWAHNELLELGRRHAVTVVRRITELEGKHLYEITAMVQEWEAREGVVVQMNTRDSAQGQEPLVDGAREAAEAKMV